MLYIRPVSDLRNKYLEIESLEKYSEMLSGLEEEKKLLSKFGVEDIDKALEEAEVEANSPDSKYYSHEEIN